MANEKHDNKKVNIDDGLAQWSQMYTVCPKEWRHTHQITGSFELDAGIERCKNVDMKKKLSDYITHDATYGPITGYAGYRGYRGDN